MGHLGRVLGKISKKGRVPSTFGKGFGNQNAKKKSLKCIFKTQLAFPGVFLPNFCDVHVFESQLAMTCFSMGCKTLAGRTNMVFQKGFDLKKYFFELGLGFRAELEGEKKGHQ